MFEAEFATMVFADVGYYWNSLRIVRFGVVL